MSRCSPPSAKAKTRPAVHHQPVTDHAAAEADEPPSPDLARFYSQDVEWTSCEGASECATLEVPLDYDDPGGTTIDLAVLRAPADDPEQRVGSLVVNPGGPGQLGTDFAAQSDLAFGDPLLESFDIVGFDPRGVGDSAPVDCLG